MMKKRIINSNLPQRFLKARDCLMSHFRPILQHFGVTEQQWRILRILDEREQLEPREICDLCQILSPSMAGVLARMEQMELIVRARFEQDQRRVLVKLAPKGEQLISVMAPLIDAQYQHLERAFGKSVLEEVSTVLERFIALHSTPVQQVVLPGVSEVDDER